ncbi:Demethylmenaquinone methyltransferase [Glycine max]|nr:Demethylmenaquinone methyltransferase [Glycine max]
MALSSPLQNLSALISAKGNATAVATPRPPRGRPWAVHAAASDTTASVSVQMGEYEEGKLERPKWVGETPLSRLVQALISFKPLYSVLKLGARRALISTAEKNNIPWRQMAKEILESEVYRELDNIQNQSLVYPDYYLNPFHAYDEGNLTWLAAAEAEAATLSIAKRAIPDASSTQEANQILRGNWLRAIEQHHMQYSESSVINDILDIGCSVGISTRYLADKFPTAKVTGLDLSPYFLAVAQHKEKNAPPRKFPVRWIHANGEDTGLPSKSFNLVSIAFVVHECPARVIVNLVREAFRLLRPGGTLALVDSTTKSKVLQELSPVLFTLLKSTEPFLDEYYLTDMDETLREAGFGNITSILTDPRHIIPRSGATVAAEAEAATMSMARRALPDASSIQEANQILHGNWLCAIEQHHIEHSESSVINDILDIGCSVGISTRYLVDKFHTAKVTGLDLSPYFLAVAQHKEKRTSPGKFPKRWIHANGEDTGLPSKSFDLVSIAFVLHECPTRVIVTLVREAFRLLWPGGTLDLTDFLELSPVLFILVKSTEAFLDEYYLTDMDETLREAGFVNITSILTDPRHVTITATVPQ